MHTPFVALTWEFWRRHQPRLIAMVSFALGFALFYPKLCALAGFNPSSPDAVDEFVKITLSSDLARSPLRIIRAVGVLFLAGGPVIIMIISLLCLVWMSTMTEIDPKTKALMSVTERSFILPVSTSFIYWWLWLAGVASVLLLFGFWNYLVPIPHFEVFGCYQNGLAWITLLVLTQAISWALAGWPMTRVVMSFGLVSCFLFSAGLRQYVNMESPYLLVPVCLLGMGVSRIGLEKARHGQWQGWSWKWRLASINAGGAMRGPARFSSPEQAQLWFEWRRFARRLCLVVATLVIVPLVLHLLARVAFGFRPLQTNTIIGFGMCLVCVPVVIHFLFSVAPLKTDLNFLLNRPLANGQIVMATLKAAGISTVLSWAVLLLALCAMPLLGDFQAVWREVTLPLSCLALIGLGLVFWTWRWTAAGLCFALTGRRRWAGAPALFLVGAYVVALALHVLSLYDKYWDLFCLVLPWLLACSLAVKFGLAFLSFRLSLQRKLMAPASVTAYVAVWILLVAALLLPAFLVLHDKAPMLPLSLGIVLAVPLSRVGFSPIALAWNRHA